MSFVWLVAAIVFFLLGAAIDFGWLGINSGHAFGFVAIGLACLAATFFPWPAYFRR